MKWLLVVGVVVVVVLAVVVAQVTIRLRQQPEQEGSIEDWPGFFFEARELATVLETVVHEFAPAGAWLTLEGRLSGIEAGSLPIDTEMPLGLGRQTIWPRQKVIAVRITPGNAGEVCERLVPGVATAEADDVQIVASDGRLLFAIYEWFSIAASADDCPNLFAWVRDELPRGLLLTLERDGAIGSVTRTPEDWPPPPWRPSQE